MYKNLSSEVDKLKKEVKRLNEFNFLRNTLFYKAFSISGFTGDFLEFGVFRGKSMQRAYRIGKLKVSDMTSGNFDHTFSDDPTVRNRGIWEKFNKMRFIGFDSFEGMPAIKGVDAEIPSFKEGTFCSAEEETRGALENAKVDMKQIHLVKGFFEKTLSDDTAQSLKLDKISLIHIDSDLYESAVLALDFCKPFIRAGTTVIFDEWFQFRGSRNHGEQLAFREWLAKNPSWNAAEIGREGWGRICFVLNPEGDNATNCTPKENF